MLHEVIVVGGGPTGLMLACELGLMRVPVAVLERLSEPTGLSKALGMHPRSLETLDLRGLLDRFAGTPVPWINFAGFTVELPELGGSQPHSLAVPQARVEAVLEARALELGVDVRRGHELVGLHQDQEGVTVDVRGPDGEHRLRGRYLVACDGAHSAVRHGCGIEYAGTDPTLVAVLGDVRLSDTPGGALPRGLTRTGTGIVAAFPLEPGVTRVAAIEWGRPPVDRDVPVTLDELRSAIRRVLGAEPAMSDPRWLSRTTDTARQAERYRDGRVFLAGDAAHVHFAFGGQGLNTGLQDAANLGWKLAAAVRGWAPPGLLDTYHRERHAVGERVLMNTRAQVAMSAPGAMVTAVRALFGELLTREQVRRHLAEMITGVDIRYDMGADGAAHPLVGGWAPDLPLVASGGASRVGELMRGGRAVLLDLAERGGLRDVAAGWADRLDVVAARCDGRPAPADALLIRPDGYVAWAAASGEPDQEAQRELRRAAATWFGR
jgi:2-polyprenyl-6-methoxyphenol hydroxylase-like FAD-dependent oxidoreductase